MSEFDQIEEVPDPSKFTVYVTNTAPEGSEPWQWGANGKVIRMAPGETKPMPRWAFDLGCKFPNHPLAILTPEEGGPAYQETKAKQERAELAELQAAYEKKKASLEATEAEVEEGKKRAAAMAKKESKEHPPKK